MFEPKQYQNCSRYKQKNKLISANSIVLAVDIHFKITWRFFVVDRQFVFHLETQYSLSQRMTFEIDENRIVDATNFAQKSNNKY